MVRKSLIVAALMALASPLAAQEEYNWTSNRPDGHAPLGIFDGRTLGEGQVEFSYRFTQLNSKGVWFQSDSLPLESTLEIYEVAPLSLVNQTHIFAIAVGATENLVMAAALARGESVIENVAREPEIADLVRCLRAMGARIEGAGSDVLRIQGVAALSGAEHSVIPDRIEAATHAMAAAITDGALEIVGARIDLMGAVVETLEQCGVRIEETETGLRVARANGRIVGVDVLTEPYPGFPTDLQAQMMALMTVADGASMITEAIFENRFMHVPELARMGANINPQGSSAMVRGVDRLTGAPVMATDLRASVSLVLAGLAAEGETVVGRVYHLDRGYERLVEKLRACGADIERIAGEES